MPEADPPVVDKDGLYNYQLSMTNYQLSINNLIVSSLCSQ